MPFPAPGFVATLVIKTPHKLLRCATYWSADTAPADEVHLTVMCDAVKTHFTPHLTLLMPYSNYFQRVEGRWYGAGSSFFFANSTAAAGRGQLGGTPSIADDDDGSETEDTMPDESALIIQRKTGLAGRANQGRIFLPGLSEQIQFAGEVVPEIQASAKTLAGRFATDINVNGSGFTTVLHARHWNRKDNQLKPITKVYVIAGLGSRRDRRTRTLRERL